MTLAGSHEKVVQTLIDAGTEEGERSGEAAMCLLRNKCST